MKRRGFLAFLIAAPVTSSLPWPKIANVLATIAPATAARINLTITEIIAETMLRTQEKIIANILQNNALLKRLKDNGTVRPFSGGITVEGLE